MATSRRAALYVRVSTSDRGQTVENQLQPLQEAAGRLGRTVVAIYRDEGISGTRARDNWPDYADYRDQGWTMLPGANGCSRN